MDTFPVTARSLEPFFKEDGDKIERSYKDHLSGYRNWEQLSHADDWVLLSENMGEHLSIDETSLHDDLFTFLTNKDGHGKKGTMIAAVKGTRADHVINILMNIPEKQRLAVKEVTMDFSDSMYSIIKNVFPNAEIVIDCFHIIKRCGDAVEEIRLRSKRESVIEQRRQRAEHKKNLEKRAKQRKYYRRRHPKTYKGKKRGRKPTRLNTRFKPEVLSNGDTVVELLTRGRCLLSMSRDKWSKSQKKRAELIFERFPKIKEAYSMVDKLRAIFRTKSNDRKQAATKLKEWYQKVADCTLREVKSARDAIKFKEEEVLNYFNERATNASAESFNSKIKRFRALLHGVSDLPFFLFRLIQIFG